MATVKMQKLSICANKKNRKAILELLQSLGCMEIRSDMISDNELGHMDTQSQRNEFDRYADSLEDAIGLLNRYAPEKKSGLALIQEKEVVTRQEFEETVRHHQTYVTNARAILRAEKEIEECLGAIGRNQNMIDSLVPWMKLDISLGEKGSRSAAVLTGTVPGEYTADMLLAEIGNGLEDPSRIELEVIFSEAQMTYLSLICMRNDLEAVEKALREIGFARPQISASGIPRELAGDCEQDIKRQEARIVSMKTQISGYAGEREVYRVIADYYRTRAEKYRLLGTIPQSENVFFLEGWIPEERAGQVSRILEDTFHAVVEKEEKREDELVPTLLRNNHFSESAEGILESYGLPEPGRLDPTFLMSIFYVFFFGMMLSDAAYGIIMAAATGVILIRHKRLESGLSKMLRLFFWCGLSTTFWGFMFGGFFGDALTVIARTFFGYTGESAILPPLWFEPLKEPMQLLMWCMLFGLIHLYVGLGAKGYELLKAGDIVGFFSDIVAWFLFLTGLVFLLLPTELFESIGQIHFNFPSFVSPLAKAMTWIGLITILLMSGRDKKNWGLRIALGAYDIYGVTGWLSDVLSYSRLLALGLATGVIASVINMIASMFGGGFVGALVFIIVFVFGHTLNMAINLLGAYVHTNRLQYVEFFGKFYDAGGEAFRPFRTKNKFIEIKEEK